MSRPIAPIRQEPLWVRVDRNRVKLAVFVVLFVVGSSALLTTAMILVPGTLLSVLADDYDAWFARLALVAGVSFAGLLVVGALLAAVQLANSEDWVRSRLGGRDMAPTEAGALREALSGVALAAGLAAPPRLMLLDSDGVNALSLGTPRKDPVIGVTRGFMSALSIEEQTAVVAVLTARIVAGDTLFGTALAALMGPLKAVRELHKHGGNVAAGCAEAGCSDPGCASGCTADGCLDLGSLDSDDGPGCLGFIGVVVFVVVVAAITYAAVLTSAWVVTLWGRALHRTSYEKADAEGMLLLKDPGPMLSAMRVVTTSSNEVGDKDASYDAIFYAATSGTPSVEKVELRRYRRLQEILGVEGLAAPDPRL